MKTQRMMVLLGLLLVVCVLGASLLHALTLTGLSWSPTSPKTNNTINCSWTFSGDTLAQNITFLKDDVVFSYYYENASLMTLNTSKTISSGDTAKNQDWTCRVTLYNATANTTTEVDVTILNTAPETEGGSNGIFNSSAQDIGTNYTVAEDDTFTLDVNASDIDGDSVTYYPTQVGDFCQLQGGGGSTGLYTCTPLQADIGIVNIDFIVSDGQNFGGRPVYFNVTPTNDAPVASLTAQTTPVNTTLTYDFDATDEESNTPFTFTLLNNPSEISNRVSIQALDGDTARFTYNATPPDYNDVNASGWLITVQINDTDNGSAEETFLLNITSVGREPVITNFTPATNPQGRYTINEDSFFQINLTATDPDGNDIHDFSEDVVKSGWTLTDTQTYINVSNTTAQINFTPTDAAVGNYSIVVTVEDRELLTDTITFNFTIVNTNDPPVLYNESYDASNTNANTDMSNLTSYSGSPFVFVVNATDDDLDSSDVLTYSDNASLFVIDNETGIINFTPQAGDVSTTPYSINVSVRDLAGETVYEIIDFWILNNTAPYFNPVLPNKTCPENATCSYDLSTYAQEDDGGDSIISYTTTVVNGTLSELAYNDTTGLISFTPYQSSIGNYTINVTIEDTRGGTASQTFILEVNNTADAPVFQRYDFSGETIVETHPFSYQLQASDYDLLVTNSTEYLNFSDNLTFTNITYQSNASDYVYALLSFTPTLAEVGSHTVQINVTDSYGLIDTQTITFTVFGDTDAPDISEIQPYGVGGNNFAPNETFITTASLGTNNTRILFLENRSYKFAHVTTDETPMGSLTTEWYYDEVLVSSAWNYSRDFNFTSSGAHELQLRVSDTRLETSYFTWNLTINNLNRAPILANNLSEIDPFNESFIFPNYLNYHNATTFFIDPDDDVNDNGVIGGSETNSLTYTVSACLSAGTTIADITISGHSITLSPEAEGTCVVQFNATDGQYSVESNLVLINVTGVPEGEEEVQLESAPSGGGGSTTRTSFIPITQETETPEPLNILAPKLVTIHDNNSVVVPFTVKNVWKDPLEFIQLGAISNESQVTATLSSNLIETLDVNESADVFLIVENYRLGNHYEVKLEANVSSPEFTDTALVLLTSIEQASQGDEVEVKVTFARDLFNEHPECQELNELLDKANVELQNNNFIEAKKYVDTAINGCRYIVSTLQQRTDRPDALSQIVKLDELTLKTALYLTFALIGLITLAFIFYYHYTNKEEYDI